MTFREFRQKKGLTQEQMADALEISRISIVRLEAQGANPKADLIRRLMRVFSLPIEQAWAMFDGTSEDGDPGDV